MPIEYSGAAYRFDRFLLLSDNGASQEGGPGGVLHEMKYFNLLVETPDGYLEPAGGVMQTVAAPGAPVTAPVQNVVLVESAVPAF